MAMTSMPSIEWCDTGNNEIPNDEVRGTAKIRASKIFKKLALRQHSPFPPLLQILPNQEYGASSMIHRWGLSNRRHLMCHGGIRNGLGLTGLEFCVDVVHWSRTKKSIQWAIDQRIVSVRNDHLLILNQNMRFWILRTTCSLNSYSSRRSWSISTHHLFNHVPRCNHWWNGNIYLQWRWWFVLHWDYF